MTDPTTTDTCICGLSEHPSLPRLDIVCPVHDGHFVVNVKATTDRGIDLADPIELSQLLELSGNSDLFLTARMKRGLTALIARLRTAEVDLEIRSEQLANVQNRLTKERKEHEEQVGREIRVRNTVIAKLEAKLAAAEAEIERLRNANA